MYLTQTAFATAGKKGVIQLLGINVLGTCQISLGIHDFSDSVVGKNASRREFMSQGCVVSRVAVAVEVSSRWVQPPVLLHDDLRRDQLATHIR